MHLLFLILIVKVTKVRATSTRSTCWTCDTFLLFHFLRMAPWCRNMQQLALNVNRVLLHLVHFWLVYIMSENSRFALHKTGLRSTFPNILPTVRLVSNLQSPSTCRTRNCISRNSASSQLCHCAFPL